MIKLLKYDLFDEELIAFLKEGKNIDYLKLPDEQSISEEDFNNLPLTKEHRNQLLVKLTALVDEAVNIPYVIKQIYRLKNLLSGGKNAWVKETLNKLGDVTSVTVGKNGSVEFYTSVKTKL